MSDDGYTAGDLVAALAPTLGQERADELVRSALVTLRVTDESFSSRQAERVLELIGRNPGFVGSVARFALARFTLKDAHRSPSQERAAATPRPARTDVIAHKEVAVLLAPTLGVEKSDEVVLDAIRRLKLPEDGLTHPEGLAVLEQLAETEGLVGVAARFAKAHFLMRAR